MIEYGEIPKNKQNIMASDINRAGNYFFRGCHQKILFSVINFATWVILQKGRIKKRFFVLQKLQPDLYLIIIFFSTVPSS